MTVLEYRTAKPNCKYCDCRRNGNFFAHRCEAKNKELIFNEAKKCPIYRPKAWSGY